jgi:hypothetical protein
MLGHHLIERSVDEFADNGAILSVSQDGEALLINGLLLQQSRTKNDIITPVTIDAMTWKDPVELYDMYDEKEQKPGNLLGAGEINRIKGRLFYSVKLLNPKYCENLNFIVSRMGLNAFERVYPVVPILQIKNSEAFCTICNEDMNICKHEVGKDYVRNVCRRRIAKATVACLVWSGIRTFIVDGGVANK